MARRRAMRGLLVGLLVGAVALVLAASALITALTRSDGSILPEAERCVATARNVSVAVDLEQARNAAVIAGVAMRRQLPPRAVSIALTTAYQESGIRNLNHGDRDSVGLFQQRPSQGWGSPSQIMDPHYSAGKFYDALVKVRGWQTGDITEVAQKVQRSGYPEAYRDHEADAQVLASVLTGQSAAALDCVDRTDTTGGPQALRDGVRTNLGVVKSSVNGNVVIYRAGSTAQAWAIAHHALANSGPYGVGVVQVGDRTWTHQPDSLPGWAKVDRAAPSRQVVITLR